MGKIENNKKQKREALFNAAFELFTAQGIAKTTINDIVQSSGVAKGTFYLYFKDKYDIRDKLIAHKIGRIFYIADAELKTSKITDFTGKILFLTNHIIDQLITDKSLLTFISNSSNWGIFKNALISTNNDYGVDFYDLYSFFENSPQKFKNLEVLLFMIAELIISTGYSSILYNEPVGIEELKPYLFDAIRQIIQSQSIMPEEG